MDEYRMARRVLMAEVSGRWVRGRQVSLDGWCQGGLRRQWNNGGGCLSMSKRSERVESPGTNVTE